MAAARHLQMPSAASPADTMGESGASALADGMLDDQLLEEDLDEVLQTLLQPRRGGSAGGTQGSGLELPPAGAPGWSSAKPTIAAAAPPLVTTGERSCWGAVLMGSNERCTPSFEIGKGHFKNKFCPNCRTAGVPLPASRVRAIASSQHREWANDMHLGLWSENRDGGQARAAPSPFRCPVPRPSAQREHSSPPRIAGATACLTTTGRPLRVARDSATTAELAPLPGASLPFPCSIGSLLPPFRSCTTVWSTRPTSATARGSSSSVRLRRPAPYGPRCLHGGSGMVGALC